MCPHTDTHSRTQDEACPARTVELWHSPGLPHSVLRSAPLMWLRRERSENSESHFSYPPAHQELTDVPMFLLLDTSFPQGRVLF